MKSLKNYYKLKYIICVTNCALNITKNNHKNRSLYKLRIIYIINELFNNLKHFKQQKLFK